MYTPAQGAASGRGALQERDAAEFAALRLLVGSLAHDFNNLLTTIAGHASLIEAEADPGSEVQESARAVVQAAERASRLVRELRHLVRPTPSEQRRVDLHEVISEVVDLIRPLAHNKVSIHLDLRAPAAVVKADPEQMHQMLLNLLLNARDAMPDGGVLTVETAADEASGRLAITVRDTGCGIASEDLSRIFEPFFTTRRAQGGTGLGLAIVARIVKKHGGTVSVESTPGRGSAFRVSLPFPEQTQSSSA